MGRRRSSCTERARPCARVLRGSRADHSRSALERGIATVEGLIVIGSLAIFLTLIPFSHRLFATWYELQAGTRERALTTASRGCVEGHEGSDPAGAGGSVDDVRRVASDKGDPGAKQSLEQTIGNVHAHDARRVGIGVFSATVTARSHGSCNERPHDTSVQGWSEFGFEKHQGGGS